MAKWTSADIPSQRGRCAVVTGTGGLGLETAIALARSGADVIIAGRNRINGEEAVARIQAAARSAKVLFEIVDLADLKSIEDFGNRLKDRQGRLDILINNAGVMRPPKRLQTADGFEIQFGTNHLGHFALTAHLLPLLRAENASRVISLSSVAAHGASLQFDNLQGEMRYEPMSAYGQSKLACLMFAYEFQRRSEAAGWGIASLAAHPGLSKTNLLFNAPGGDGHVNPLFRLLRMTMQSAAQGALPTLYAATSPGAKPGGFYGPDQMRETRGHPSSSNLAPQARDPSVASQLWDVSERLTGMRFGEPVSAQGARQ